MNVSICIPTYNQASYLEQAIRSAAQQSLVPTEIIVSDDCSTDQTTTVLHRLSNEIPFLKVVRQPENIGIAKNTDACLRLATGEFIVRLDSDDRLLPDYTQKLAQRLSDYPEAGYAHAAIQEINQNGDSLQIRKLFRTSGFQSGNDALRAAVRGYRVAANIIMFRRTALVQVNFLTDRPNYVEDYHLTTSLTAAGFGNVYLNEILSFYRIWVDEGKVRQRRKLMEITGVRRVFDEVIEPAFVARGWHLSPLKNSRTAFACRHADCLSWDVYTAGEKLELAAELRKLSSAPGATFYLWLYSNGFEKILDSYSKLRYYSLRMVKLFLLNVKTQ